MIFEMALGLAAAVFAAQDAPAAQSGPRSSFFACPGHPRCPRPRPVGESGAPGPDPSSAPTYGEVRLNGGFAPDPFVVEVQAGGGVEVSSLVPGCGGFFAEAPDVSLNYVGGTLPLLISADADADTILLVNAPDGSWHCDDDGGRRDLNPALRFEQPRSGRYDIWLGTRRGDMLARARLQISELYSQ